MTSGIFRSWLDILAPLVGQIVTRVANAWPRRQQDERLLEGEHDLHCSVNAVSGYEVRYGLDVRLGSR